jgi:hypothetical protein
LSEVARIMDLARRLGRRACGMADDEPLASPQQLQRDLDLEAALNKIYGDQHSEHLSTPPSTPNPQPPKL